MHRSMRYLLAAVAAVAIPVAVAPSASAADLVVTSFGATPNDSTDDTVAIQAAMDALAPGQTLNFPAGTYDHNAVLRLNVANTYLHGPAARLSATNEAASAFDVNANGVTVDGITFGTPVVTQRFSTPSQHKVTVIGQSGVNLWQVKVAGSSAAGIFIENSTDFHLTDTDVRTTRGAGLLITGGSNNGDSLRHRSTGTFDDGIAVRSLAATGMVHHVDINDAITTGTGAGRGIAVVGGEDVIFRNARSEDAAEAAIAVTSEATSLGVNRVQVLGATVLRANQSTAVQHGAVLASGGKAGAPVQNVKFKDFVISGTRATAPRNIGAVVENGGSVAAISFENVAITGGPVGYQGNAPSGTVTFTNVTKDGVALTAP